MGAIPGLFLLFCIRFCRWIFICFLNIDVSMILFQKPEAFELLPILPLKIGIDDEYSGFKHH